MLNESQRAALEAFCDTIVPSIERADDPDGHLARKASDLLIAAAAEQLIVEIPDEVTRGGLLQLLDVLGCPGPGDGALAALARADPAQHLVRLSGRRQGHRRAQRA